MTNAIYHIRVVNICFDSDFCFGNDSGVPNDEFECTMMQTDHVHRMNKNEDNKRKQERIIEI